MLKFIGGTVGIIFLIGLLAVAVAAAAVLVWKLSSLLLLVFGAVLVALLLRAFADFIDAHTPIHDRWSLLTATVLIVLVLAGFTMVTGAQLAQQFADLLARLPQLMELLREQLGISDLEAMLEERLGRMVSSGGILSSIAGYSTGIVGALANAFLVLVAGIYLAVNPGLYRRGLLALVPPAERDQAADTLDTLSGALKLWIVGQLVAMVLVGTLTTVGLWLLGIQSALALGFIAGILEFVPFVGPILSAIPAIALALAKDPLTALWVLGLYVLVQQIEGNLITPLIQQRAVDLPPVVTIFAIVGFGVIFGPLGVLFATPLAVVSFVLVKKLWVQETLGEETEIPGDGHEHHT